MTHHHDFQTTLVEMLPNGSVRVYQECECQAKRHYDRKVGLAT